LKHIAARLIATCLALFSNAPFLAPSFAAEPSPSPEQIEFFEKKVRPVLIARCVKCHGDKKAEAGLRLDTKAGLAHGIDGVAVVVAGNVDASRIIKVSRYDDDVQMPPEGKMPDVEIAALETWVKQGAYWPGEDGAKPAMAAAVKDWPARIAEAQATHWAFRPIQNPRVPEVRSSAWALSPVDSFILQKLEQTELKPAAVADRRTLLRRVTFDLIGLPPTVAEYAAFEQDSSPDAWSKVVDRLLASPHYGERWGRHWLDIARYADTKGYAFQQDRRYPYAYTYRDYVVDAFNADLPFDQFVTEQLAADLLPARSDNRHLAALGLLTVGRRIGVEDDIDDRIDVVSRGMLGLSIACARCHDHKYDAIPTDDYYSLYGVFRSCTEPADLPLLAEPELTAEYLAFKAELDRRQAVYDKARRVEADKLEEQLRIHAGDYLAAVMIDARGKASLEPYKFATAEPRAPVMRHWKEYLKHSANQPDPVFSVWHRFAKLPTDKFAVEAEKVVTLARDGAKELPINPRLRDLLVKNPPTKPLDVAKVYDELFEGVRARWNDTVATAAKNKQPTPTQLADPADETLRQVLYGPSSPAVLTVDQANNLFDPGANIRLVAVKKKVDEWLSTSDGAPPRAMVMVDKSDLFNPAVHVRGNPALKGKKVPRQFVALATSGERKPFVNGSGRLELAQAIVDPRNPLTARVIANRVWQHHFGKGLVRTPSDFGVRGEPPTHPELLDFLASRLVDDHWSLKNLHRLLLSSRVYQQSSHVSPQAAKLDPENRLLSHTNRRRLEFEAIRDAMLVAAGRLDAQVGGRPVSLTAKPFTGRRSLYGYIDRQDLPDLFRTFDFASPDVSTEQRPQTTVPQQALFAMNAPFVIEQAREIARRAHVASSRAEEIALVYRAIFGRDATVSETALAHRFIEQAAAQPGPTPTWQYGYGELNGNGQVSRYTPFQHFTGKTWQPGEKMPDPKLGHLKISAGGGHAGNPIDGAAILRWTAPCDGSFVVEGAFEHPNDKGDGVLATVSYHRDVLCSAAAFNGKTKVMAPRVELKAGDTIDIAIHCRKETSHDSYILKPVIKQIGGADMEWNAEKEFRGPPTPPLGALEMLSQVLLLTNEAMFVD